MKLAYSVREFCDAVGISRRWFYVLQSRGEAPPVVRIGRRVLVPRDAAEHWLRDRQAV